MSSDVADEDYLTRYFRSTKYGSGTDYFDRVEMMTDDNGKPMAKVTFKDPYPPIAMASNSLNEQKLGEGVKVEVCSTTTTGTVTGTEQQGSAGTTDTTTGTEQQGSAGTTDTIIGTEQQRSAGTTNTTTDTTGTEQQGLAGTTDTTTDTGTTSGSKSSDIIQPISKTGRLPLRPLLAQYLQQYPKVLDELAKEVKVSAIIEESVVVIKPITEASAPSDTTDNPAESMADAVKRFRTKLLGSVSYSDVDISLPTGSDISYYSDEIKQCNKLNILHELNQNRVTLVGNRVAVVEMERYIEKISGKPVQVVEECFLDPQDYTFFVKCGYKKTVANPPDVKLLKNEVEWSILVLGSIDDVYQFVTQLLPTMLSHIRVPLGMSAPMVRYIRGKLRMRMNGMVSREGITPYIFPPDGVDHCNLSILCADEEAVELSKSSIRELKKMFPF